AEIGRSLADMAVAPSQATNLTDRHHILSHVFEYSWQLLSLQQQQILARLSAFRGGFDRAAASSIAQSNLSDLSMLIAHSLVQRLAAGRYDLHPLVQEFAASKVMANEVSQLLGAHSYYYLTALTERTLPSLLPEFGNLRFAWQRAIELTESAEVVAALRRSVLLFGKFMLQFGTMADGHLLFQRAANHFETVPEQREILAQLLEQQSLFAVAIHGPPAAILVAQRVLTLSEDLQLRLRMHMDLGNYHAELGQWEAADAHFDQSEQLAGASADLALYIGAVEARIHINAVHFRGDFARAIQQLEEAIRLLDSATPALADADELYMRLYQSLVLPAVRHRDYTAAIHYTQRALALVDQQIDRRRRCYVLRDLALAEQFAGFYEAALAHLQEALALAEEIGDVNEMGLLNANHCLTLRQTGALDAALDYGRKAIDILGSMKQPRIEGQARNRIGHTLLELEQWAAAETAYCEALVVWDPLHHPNRYEAVAGRAVALYQLGRQAEALAAVDEVLNFVDHAGLVGIVEPVLLLLNCETVLAGNGALERAEQTLNLAQQWVQTVVERNKDASIRAAFLARPNNLQLAQRCKNYQNKAE
ncbi:MAG: tetratricopeptide repeat protein, partial [Caldilineaceae bacterium]